MLIGSESEQAEVHVVIQNKSGHTVHIGENIHIPSPLYELDDDWDKRIIMSANGFAAQEIVDNCFGLVRLRNVEFF